MSNVEIDSGKWLLVYYDKSDRSLVDSFKRVINQQYGLSNPDAPEKRHMTVLSRGKKPKDKKMAQEAINRLLEG